MIFGWQQLSALTFNREWRTSQGFEVGCYRGWIKGKSGWKFGWVVWLELLVMVGIE